MPDTVSRMQRAERLDLRALYETSQLLSGSLDLEFVLNSLLLTAMSKLLVTRGVVLLHDPVAGNYRAEVVKGIAELSRGDRLELPLLVEGSVLRDGDVPEILARYGLVLAIPLSSRKREMGFVALGRQATGEPYDDRELEFVRSLVNMSSTAVHNSLMVEELKLANRDLGGKIQELNTLFDLSQEFNATLDREHLVKLLSFALMGQMLVSKHLFLLRHHQTTSAAAEGSATFQVVAARGVRDGELPSSTIDALCNLRELVLLEDAADVAWQPLREKGLVLVMPLLHQGETCGALCLGPKMTGQPYGPGDVEFLSAIGHLAFVSIQNTFLVEEQIEKERLEEEMRLARGIQERLLPQEIPTVPGTDVAALALPSRFVGGDYFGVTRLGDDRLLLAIADVTGKGVPAALLMANLQASLHVMLPLDLPIEEMTAHINRVICDNTDFDKFITFFLAIYDPASGRLDYVNAGHNPPMLVRAGGEVELLDVGGLLLGVMRGMPYDRGTVQLVPGDVLVLFTDGVTEAMSLEAEEYGEERLLATLRAHRSRTAQDLLDAVWADVRTFTRDPETLSDDLTMVVLRTMERAAI